MKLKLLSLLSHVALIGFLATGPSFADTTPEDVVAAYIEGVADRDMDAIIAATAADNMSKRFDFVSHVDRLQSLVLVRTPLPVTDSLFIEINKAYFVAQIAGQVKFLTYGLMTTKEIGTTLKMDAAAATDFASTLRADRLSSLELLKIGIPQPEILNKEGYQLNANRRAKVYGADALTERLALVSFEGLTFVVGFTLLKYGDEWGVESQSSPIGELGFGLTKRVTLEQFENMLK